MYKNLIEMFRENEGKGACLLYTSRLVVVVPLTAPR